MVLVSLPAEGENETADIRTEHYGGTTQVRRLKRIYHGSEGGYKGWLLLPGLVELQRLQRVAAIRKVKSDG
jgi:hypothetical protein